MSSPLASNEDLAHSQTSSAIPLSTTESSDMAGPTETTEESREEQVKAEQEHIHSPEMPVVDQATKCDTPEPEDSFDTKTNEPSSTPAQSSDLPAMATPRSSISPGPEVTPYGLGSNTPKRPHEAMAGPLPDESRKVAKLSESLPGTQDVEHSFAEGSNDSQPSKTGETSRITSVGSVEEEDEEDEMPTKTRMWRKTGVTRDDRSEIASVEAVQEADEEEETPTILPRSSFKTVASAESDEDPEEEMPTKRKTARKAAGTKKRSYMDFIGSGIVSAGEDEQDLPKRKGVARTVLSRSSSSVSKTNKRSRVASVGPDEEDDEEEPPAKKSSAREAELTRDESLDDLVEDPEPIDLVEPSFDFKPSVLRREESPDDLVEDPDNLIEDPEPTYLIESTSDFKISESTIYSQETSDPRKRSPQPPLDSGTATPTTPSQPPTKSYLHRLPGELRNRIYTHLGLRSVRLDLDTLQMPPLMVAYPDLKNEMLSIVLSDNKLRVAVFSDFRIKQSEQAKGPKQASSVGNFQVGTVAIGPENWVMDIDPHFVTIKHIGMRIMEVPNPDRTNELRPICDYFLNVSVTKGKPTRVSHKSSLMASTATQRESRAMCELATARAKRFGEQEGFAGFTWKQVQEIASSFESVIAAKEHFTKKKGKVLLN
jgi:hypothetical protein